MALLALSRELQSKLGKQSEQSADIGRYRIRKQAIEWARDEAKYFADDSCPDSPNHDPENFKKLTPVIELAGTASARSGAFVQWLDADKNRCLILVQSGVGLGLVVVSDRRCLTLQCEQLSLF